jgi:iron complex transport system ATP-binding protein
VADLPEGGAVIGLSLPGLSLGPRQVLGPVTLDFRPGEVTALCGPNGAGKTTLLRALAGLLPGTPPRDPRLVAYLPQGAASAWGMTVREVAALGRIPHGDADSRAGVGAIAAALAACDLVGLQSARIDRISGGQARRAMLARALATEPEVFLLDEPTADLDPAAAHQVMRLLAGRAAAGAAVIAVLHAVDLAQLYADRMIVLADGHIRADAPPAEALPVAAAAFGLPLGLDPRPRLLPPA